MSVPMYNWIAGRIKNKILFFVLAVFVIVYGATLSYTYSSTKADLLRAATEEAQSTAETLALTLWRNYEFENDSRDIQSYLHGDERIKSDNLIEVNVFDRSLEVVSSTKDENLGITVEGEIYNRAIANTPATVLVLEAVEPFIHIVYPVSAEASKANVSTGAIEMKFNLERQFRDLADLRVITVTAGFVILAAISIVITIISHSITRPIQNLYAGMNQVVGLRREVLAFNEGREGEVDVGIGINSGELILGTMGTTGRIDTTVIGSTVNVASRLESLTKEFNVPIIIAAAVYESLSQQTRAGLNSRELGPVKIRGIDDEVNLIGVTG